MSRWTVGPTALPEALRQCRGRGGPFYLQLLRERGALATSEACPGQLQGLGDRPGKTKAEWFLQRHCESAGQEQERNWGGDGQRGGWVGGRNVERGQAY